MPIGLSPLIGLDHRRFLIFRQAGTNQVMVLKPGELTQETANGEID